uniref:Ovule protein n=1 Tax=Mesocestoides corti TaxID=53468 RepID=A0A5K3FUN7_MESCO
RLGPNLNFATNERDETSRCPNLKHWSFLSFINRCLLLGENKHDFRHSEPHLLFSSSRFFLYLLLRHRSDVQGRRHVDYAILGKSSASASKWHSSEERMQPTRDRELVYSE